MMNNENGRSMVEMLGVLAIIGVLSVAGIAGYSMAMKKYRVNEIVNAASQVAILALAKYETTQTSVTDYTASQAGLGTAKIGGVDPTNIKATANSTTKQINITLPTEIAKTDIQAVLGTDCMIGEHKANYATMGGKS